jgi:hypothetical protein
LFSGYIPTHGICYTSRKVLHSECRINLFSVMFFFMYAMASSVKLSDLRVRIISSVIGR